MNYKLYLFDLDGTLADMKSEELYDHARIWFERNPDKVWGVVTNQGGVGLRHWMEENDFGTPEEYPTESRVEDRLQRLFWVHKPNIILKAFRYYSNKGNWSPVPKGCENLDEWKKDWRKPAPGMIIRAMQVLKAEPYETIVIGDREEDFLAASKAGAQFAWAGDFFDVNPF